MQKILKMKYKQNCQKCISLKQKIIKKKLEKLKFLQIADCIESIRKQSVLSSEPMDIDLEYDFEKLNSK